MRKGVITSTNSIVSTVDGRHQNRKGWEIKKQLNTKMNTVYTVFSDMHRARLA